MCGIFGFLGLEDCFKYGVHGLRQLQNRGYDSAGCCAVSPNHELILRKYATTKTLDSIDQLESMSNDFLGCSAGIFHTRWATHGAKTDANAHPHLDNSGRIALVHNGIIENYYELKLELESQYNIKFKSETDTEVIVNLISVYYDQTADKEGVKHMESAIMKAISRLQGTWALVVLCKDKPDNMYCARHGSPLLVGFGGPYIMVTSEQAGFGKYVNNYICLNNGDLTVIRRRGSKISFDNIENYVLRDVTVKSNELTPEPFQHWTLKEIHEQYEASIRAISFGGRIVENDKVRLGGPMMHEEALKQIDHLILLGCGTSLNAGQHSIAYFKDLCNFTTVQAFDGSEFVVDDIPKRGRSCAVFLSQSGETKDLYRCIKICRDANVFTIGVINVVDSLIAREVNCGCYLNAGREVGVASTKAFTSQVILLSMLAIFFAQINDLNKSKREQYIKALRQLPTDIKKVIQSSDETCKKIASYLITQKDMFVLGKGSMISVASEGALKTKEIGYIHSEAYGGNALRHGPYAVIESGTPIVFLNPYDQNFALMNNTVEEVKSRDAYPIVISDTHDTSRHAQQKIVVPNNRIYTGILHNIPMQLIAYYMAVGKGHNPDMPKNLSKCVSV
ncbi:glucosamine-fructose-6-phosphate aminotransferase [Yasminevirus sp. GU-2018]|uniref:glutamine--fructose-6-phosphate transaminase (isomerizing) n=1 Tax=Yasminevirus sp. GU-2018 TaxID=2420051 RepID=A0A5K0U7B9_9VIRU|nr:glucosamine-fructose-6-phosphate aminotransferase [Yasminevirus sp. GU-2018]